MFVRRDSFILLGFNQYQKFNLTTQLWTPIYTTPPSPIGLNNPACIVLPNEEILVAGSINNPSQSSIYNHLTNTWRSVANTNAPQGNKHTEVQRRASDLI
jgi:hypothetical protein